MPDNIDDTDTTSPDEVLTVTIKRSHLVYALGAIFLAIYTIVVIMIWDMWVHR